jgi:hypothetical protein|tara:strand:+ start:988 stop:1179 length:192 start_codon:yes stop_codon:yes gene_type:complete
MYSADLAGWDNDAENRKVVFMDHLYKESGRTNGLYTGLWQDFVSNYKDVEEAKKAKAAYFGLK